MKYRDIVGFSKKKQQPKKSVQKPKSNPILEDVQKEFGYINEVGAAPQHKKFITKIDKAEQNLHKNIQLYKNFLISQGQKNAGMELSSKYVTNIGGFTHYLKTTWVKMIRKMI